MMPPMLLALTSHGNAPYLMAARLANALGRAAVVIPDYYGDTQRRILLEELPDCGDYVWLSSQLGDILRPLLLDVSSGKSFGEFGAQLADANNPGGAAAIENRFQQAIRDGLGIERLDGRERGLLFKKDIRGVLNSTLPIRPGVGDHIFFFTGRMSQLYGSLPPGDDSPEAIRTLEQLQGYAEIWRKVEATFSVSFIPRVNAFSYRNDMEADAILTPPLAFRRAESNRLKKPALLFLPSGTRTDVRALNDLAAQAVNGYERLVLGYQRDGTDFPAAQFSRVNAAVFGDEQLQGVIARGGWGTVWECLCNEIPLAVPRLGFSDDPEIGHTQLALRSQGIGLVLEGELAPFLDETKREVLKQAIHALRMEDQAIFGALAEDGFAFMATQILDVLPGWAEKFQLQMKEAVNG